MTDAGQFETDMLIARMDLRAQEIYREAAAETEQKLNDYFAKFKVKDQIKREALKRGEITDDEYRYWRTGQLAIGERWKEMRDTLATDLHNTNNLARSMVNGYMPEVYALNHNYATFQVEKASLLDTSYTLYDRQTVERIIKQNPKLLASPGKRKLAEIAAGKDKRWQYKQLQSAITKSILMGDSIPNMAKRMARELSVKNYKSAVRYARTAATSAQNGGRVDAYKRAEEMGIDLEQEWLATLDGRTRDAHRHLDGEHVPVGQPFKVDGYEIKFPGDPSAPGHLIWNCRCTLVPRLKNLDQSDAPRNSKLGGMSYEEWKNEHQKEFETEIPTLQQQIGRATSVQEVNNIMNSQGWFRKIAGGGTRWDPIQNKYVPLEPTHPLYMPPVYSEANLTGVDLESAKSIASSYQQIFEKYPKLIGRFDAPDAQPVGMASSTYAWCYIRGNGKVQVNPTKYNMWQSIARSYDNDVRTGWHPKGTTAESIVVHEMGHAIDGLLAREKVLGGITSSGEYRYASSSLKATIMKRAAKLDSDLADLMERDRYWKESDAVSTYVSEYATKNAQEWFAECFAEYITSAKPRVVATEFGKELERLLEKLK